MTPYLAVFCRLLIGGLFAATAIAKLRDLRGFRDALRGYRLLPRRAEAPVAAGVVWTEALVPVLLLPGVTAPVGLALAAGLLTVFAAAMFSVLRRGLATSCGCAGRPAATVRPAHVWRNLALVAVCLAGAAAALAGGRVEPAVVVVLAAAAGCVVVTLMFLDDLLLLFATPAGRNRP